MKVQIYGSKESLKGFNPVKVNTGMSKCYEVIATEEAYNKLVEMAKQGKFQIVGIVK